MAVKDLSDNVREALARVLTRCPFSRFLLSSIRRYFHLSFIPHSCGDRLLLCTHGIGIDGFGAELGMAEPLLHHVERNASVNGRDAEAVAQPPLGVACAPCRPASRMTACTRRQAVVRSHDQRCTLVGNYAVSTSSVRIRSAVYYYCGFRPTGSRKKRGGQLWACARFCAAWRSCTRWSATPSPTGGRSGIRAKNEPVG